jgi:hypothetical protein
MPPTWMIEEMERERREREAQEETERARLWIEPPARERSEDGSEPEPARSAVIHIQIL